MKLRKIILAIAAVMILSCTDKQVIKNEGGETMTDQTFEIIKDYPVAAKQRTVTSIHGEEMYDDYAWMKDRERKDTKVLDHVKKENDHAKKYLKNFSKLENKIYDEIVSRIEPAMR